MRIRTMIGVSASLWIVAALTLARADDDGQSMNGPTTFSSQDGATLFQTVCQGCHMSDA